MDGVSYQAQLAYALRQLRTYNKIIRYGVPEETFNIPEIEEGFKAPFNSDAEKQAKKMLVAASTEAIMTNPAIPKSRRAKQARKNAVEIQLAFDAAKLEFVPMSQQEYNERIKRNEIARRAAQIRSAGRALKRKGTKLAIGAVLTALGTIVSMPVSIPSGVVYGIFTLLPDSWKAKAKKKTAEVVDKAARTVARLSERFAATPVGQRITQACQRISESPVVRTVCEGMARVGHRAAEVVESAAHAVNKGVQRAWDFVKSWF